MIIPCGDIETDRGVLHPYLSSETVVIINTALRTKFIEMEMI